MEIWKEIKSNPNGKQNNKKPFRSLWKWNDLSDLITVVNFMHKSNYRAFLSKKMIKYTNFNLLRIYGCEYAFTRTWECCNWIHRKCWKFTSQVQKFTSREKKFTLWLQKFTARAQSVSAVNFLHEQCKFLHLELEQCKFNYCTPTVLVKVFLWYLKH